MRVTTITLLSFLFFTGNHALAQPSAKAGTMVRQTTKQNWTDVRPMGETPDGVLYLLIPYAAFTTGPVIGKSNYYLGLVDKNGELTRKNVVDFTIDGKEATFEFFEEINGKIIIFTSVEKKKARTVTFYAYEVDKKGMTLKSPQEVVELSFASIKRDYERASFKAEPSQDKSKLLISYSLVDNENTMLSFGYVVLDSQLKKLANWGGNLDMSDGVYLFDQFRISNKGEVYLLTRYFSNNKALNKNSKLKKTNILSSTRSMEYQPNYEHRIVKFENNTNSRILRIENENTFYNALDIGVAADGKILLIGFTSDNEENLPSGAVSLRVDPKTGAVKETGAKAFGTDFLMPSNIQIKNNGLAAGKDQYLNYRFILSDIHHNTKGGYTLIGERNVTQTKRNGNYFYTVNHLDDLAVIDVSASGAINSVYKVEKSQQAESLQLLNAGYFFTEKNNVKSFAFANMGKGSHESVVVQIMPDGKQVKKTLFSEDDSEVAIRPRGCMLHQGNKLVMYATKNNRYVRWMTSDF